VNWPSFMLGILATLVAGYVALVVVVRIDDKRNK
jgi:hypothetical protein